MEEDCLTIGEVATRTGLSTSALRFYEQRGLARVDAVDGWPAPLRA